MQLYAKKIKFIQSRLRKIFAFIYNNLKKEGIVMSKTKKSKILAAALCTAVMAGIYASPVMAGTITGIPGLSTGDDEIVINGVTLKDYGTVEASQGHFANAITLKNGWLNVGEGKFFVNATDGNTEIKGTLQVTGDTTLGALTANGLADLQGGLKVTGDANLEKLNVNGKLTVDATSGVVADNLTVDNNARVQGDLTVENALTAGETHVGSLYVNTDKFTVDNAGNTTVGGKLTAGSGNFTVDAGGNTTIIGTDKQLTVEGTAQIGTMTANTAQVAGGGLTVTGATNVGTLTATGAANLQGGLTVSKGATVNGGLTVDTDRFVVDGTTGNTAVGGTLNVTGETNLNGLTAGATTVDSLKSNGNAEVGGTLDVTGKATLKGGLAVTGGTETDTLNVTGAATVGSLKVVKDAELDGNLTVKGELSAANNKFGVNGDGNIRTTGSANIGGSTTIGGLLTVTDNANITGNATVGGGLGVTGNATVGGGLGVTGNATVGGTLNVTNLSTLGGGLTVSGQTKLNNDLTVNGSAEIDGNLKIGSGNFTVDAANGNTVVKGSLHLGSLNNREVGKAIKDLEAYADELKGAALPDKVGGIERDPAGAGAPGNGTTIIEGKAKFDSEGMTIGETVVTDGAITTNTIDAGGTIINNAGMTVGYTVVNDSKITVGAADDQTIIEGGAITAKSLVLDSKDVGKTIAGIDRTEDGDIYTTTIEGALEVSNNGLISNANSSFKVDADGNLAAATLNVGGGMFNVTSTGTTMNLGDGFDYRGQTESVNLGGVIHDIDNRLDDLEYKTQNIKPGTGAGTGTGAGGASGLSGGEGTGEPTIPVPPTDEEHTGITGDVTVGGEINAGEIVVGDKGSDNKTTIDGGNVTVNGGENGSTTINGGNITTGDITAGTGNIGSVSMEGGTIKTGYTTIDSTGINTVNGNFTGDVDVDGKVTVGDGTTITGEGITTGTGTFDDVIIGENTTIDSEGINTNDITAGTGTIGNVDMDNTGITVGGGTTITEDTVTTDNIKADDGEFDSQVTVGDNTTITDGNINLGGDNGTNINADGMIVGNANGVNTNVSAGDVVITDKDGKDIALSDVGYVENIDRELQANGNYDGTVVGGINAEADIRRAEVNRLDNRISKVEDRVDKVGAMSAAIANLRTMGYDPAAPTEIAVGIGQYRSETGAALGLFHYPNKDFMLSLSVSTSGDEVMGGIGATWKFGRKSPEKMLAAEKEKAVKAKLAKAEAMKKAAVEAKVAAQQARHAQMAAEKAAK